MNKIIAQIPIHIREILIALVGVSMAMWVFGPANKMLNVLCILGMLLLITSINSYIAFHFKKERKKREKKKS